MNDQTPPRQMRLKAKYRSGGKSRFKGKPNAAVLKNRTKVGHDKHVARYGEPPKMVLHVFANGNSRMERVA